VLPIGTRKPGYEPKEPATFALEPAEEVLPAKEGVPATEVVPAMPPKLESPAALVPPNDVPGPSPPVPDVAPVEAPDSEPLELPPSETTGGVCGAPSPAWPTGGG
jgi:hypothetical protein